MQVEDNYADDTAEDGVVTAKPPFVLGAVIREAGGFCTGVLAVVPVCLSAGSSVDRGVVTPNAASGFSESCALEAVSGSADVTGVTRTVDVRGAAACSP